MRLASLRPSHSSERKSLTSPAIFQGHSDRISVGERSTPDTPATMFFQNGSRPVPTGLTTPIPVIATRRLIEASMPSLSYLWGTKTYTGRLPYVTTCLQQGSPRRADY